MASLPKDIAEAVAEPPIYWLMSTADLIGSEDGHLNPAWRGMAGAGPGTPSLPMALKYLGQSSVKISIELACGLAAVALKLPVPKPALVLCDREDLPGIPDAVNGGVLLLFGSSFTPEDTLWTRAKADSDFASELIWQRVCADPVGPKGAAWDELIANSDRHHHNLIFTGLKWWLFDHDKAIEPAGRLATLPPALLSEFPEFVSRTNLLANEMLKRHPKDHSLDSQAAEFEKQRERLKAVAHLISKWKSPDARLKGIITDAGLLANMIASRLPALALHLSRRIGKKDGGTLQWI